MVWSDGRYLVHLQAFGQHELLSYSQQSSLGPRHWQIYPNHGWCIPAETSATQEKTL
ncbi:hypothetical protein HF670_15985 [Acidithiobacillus thiooxidans]|uniref:hypothetical protein n=1 Tax=Acidithiobacillus thiooxidans TaxID=930 RepID=UPI001C07D11C|nr:hypothetical protein [Acidithiobacillus thiooxidans]MBU2840996.1 hypothetical protein [Acidithiobacillus thiooxidans]